MARDETVASLIRAQQARASREIVRALVASHCAEYIGQGDSLINLDTALLYRNDKRDVWFTAEGLNWLRIGMALSLETQQRRIHRVVFIPRTWGSFTPLEASIHAQKIQLAIHTQLWHGGICHIVPVDQHANLGRFSAVWDKSFLSGRKVIYHAKRFYEESFSGENVVQDDTSTPKAIARLARDLVRFDDGVTLFYTNEHFAKSRIRQALWNPIRSFMLMLYPRCMAEGCNSQGAVEVDHIFPIGPQADAERGRANSSLVNLRALCSDCNKRRPKRGYDRDPATRLFSEIVPAVTEQMRRVVYEKPTWLGKLPDDPKCFRRSRFLEG